MIFMIRKMSFNLNNLCATWLIVVVIMSTTHLAQCQQQQQQQQPSHYSRVAVSRFNRTTPSAANNVCEYKELMTKLHDRVGVLASLDEDQRNRLDSINKKIVQFEESNLARLDSLGVQQLDGNKRLDVIEHLQRMNNRQVEELKGEFLMLQEQQQQLHKAEGLANDIGLSRIPRQADTIGNANAPSINPNALNFDCGSKLDSLGILLTSTRASINVLHRQLGANFTKLLQTTGTLQRRLNNLARRQQSPAGVAGQAYLPPQPNFYATGGPGANQIVSSCAHSQVPSTGGIQKLQLSAGSQPFYVLCDDDIQGGGWTVIQHRFSGDLSFQRDWQEYKTGFGNLAGEFFIGLDKLHALTAASVNELLILMIDQKDEQRYAKYSLFAIGDEKELYAMNLLGTYEGDAGDSLSYHAGSKFSTFDNDNDGWLEGNCAQAHTGAWWYNACEKCNLNGQYLNGEFDKGLTFQGMYWQDFHGPTYSLKSVRMMIRPASEQYQRR